jgi:hypothetical protein
MSETSARAPFFVKFNLVLPALFLINVCMPWSITAYALDCSTADGFPSTSLSTQADVNNFQTVYGPCDTITRHLIIKGGPFSNLDGLNEITTMTGDFEIDTSSVATLAGLSNLVTIGGRFRIQSQLGGSFSSLSGLSSLTSLGELSIADTNFLTSLSGMTSLASLGGLHLESARVLTSLAGLPAGLAVERISIYSNDQLQTLDGLSPVIGIIDLNVDDNPNLTSISALAGSVFNDSYGFPASGDPVPSLMISNNPKLSSLNGVPGVLPPGAFYHLVIVRNPLITSLNVLDGVVEIWGDAGFGENAVLSDCSSLSKVMDEVDDGFPGPNEDTSDPSIFPPDLKSPNDELPLGGNATGCNTIAEILGSSSGGEVFADGFETKITE